MLSKNQILMSIKGRNSVANLRKTKIYNTNVDLVNDNVYTKFGLKDLYSTAPKRGSVFIGLMTPDGAIWPRYQRTVLMR